MKVRLVLAATPEEAAEVITAGNTLKVSAPRRPKIKHKQNAEWKAQQKKAQQYRKKNKAKIAQQAKRYRKQNKTLLQKRAQFLKKAPKARVVNE